MRFLDSLIKSGWWRLESSEREISINVTQEELKKLADGVSLIKHAPNGAFVMLTSSSEGEMKIEQLPVASEQRPSFDVRLVKLSDNANVLTDPLDPGQSVDVWGRALAPRTGRPFTLTYVFSPTPLRGQRFSTSEVQHVEEDGEHGYLIHTLNSVYYVIRF